MSLRALHDFELALLAPCLAMTRRGLKVDDDVRQEMMTALLAETEPLATALNEKVAGKLDNVRRKNLFAEKWICKACRNGSKKKLTCEACKGVGKREWLAWNPASPDQNAIVLYELLKLPKRTADGKVTTDEDALKSLLALDKHNVVAPLLQYKKHFKILSDLRERLAPGPDGRIRTWYNIAGTETGRFSSSETWLEVSTNLQNLAAKQAARSALYDIRKTIVPDVGEVFLYADLSQAEARVVAALSGDRELLEKWSNGNGFDVHIWTAAHIFNKPENEVTNDERTLGKTARHALNYGESWATFLKKVNGDADITGVAIDAPTAKRIVAGYHRLHPSLESWWRRVGRTLDSTGQLSTTFGRQRTFFGRRSAEHYLDAVHREAIAFEPQSTVADLLNRGLLRYWERYDEDNTSNVGGRLLAQVHDAILVGAPKDGAVADPIQREANRLLECLEEEVIVNGIALTIPVEIKMSAKSWSERDMTKLKLKEALV